MFERNETHNTEGKQAFSGCWHRMPSDPLKRVDSARRMPAGRRNGPCFRYSRLQWIRLNHVLTYIQKKRSMSQLIVRAGEFTFQARSEEV